VQLQVAACLNITAVMSVYFSISESQKLVVVCLEIKARNEYIFVLKEREW
jgi:hypothetical protein